MQFLTYWSTVSQLEHLGFSEVLQGFSKIFENTNYEKVKGIICIDRVQNWNIHSIRYANPVFWDIYLALCMLTLYSGIELMLMNANPVTGIVYVSDLTLTKV